MNPTLQNILGVIAGILVGGIVNMAIVSFGPSIIPPPEGVDTTTMEGLQAGIHLFEPKHFITPFLAHALGALVGAFTAAKIAVSRKMRFALILGVFFLLGGIMAVYMLPEAPIWFSVLDLVLAYIPMGYLGGKLATRNATK
ncbi:MAG: hypothetical protein R2786_09705 [Flavobacteriaceae bacterium]